MARFQSFDVLARPEEGPPRLARLRREMAREGLDGWIIPRADVHQGEYVAPCDERLAWLTGFTGSAGLAVVLADRAAVFVDGRYRIQVRAQVDTDAFTPVDWPETRLADWLRAALPAGGRVGFDPWLHTIREIETLRRDLAGSGIETCPADNLIDRIWENRPPPPDAPVFAYPEALAGRPATEKLADVAATLTKAGEDAAILTLPDSIAWLLNIRGGDIPHVPVARAFAIVHADATATLFIDPAKLDDALRARLPGVAIAPRETFAEAVLGLGGRVRVDPESAPFALLDLLAGPPGRGPDPCRMPKACKTPAEIQATRTAHLRDGAAMCRFLAWLDDEAPRGGLTEIDVVERLEAFRIDTGELRDISFETIAGAGPNGAIVHYRVTRETNRPVRLGELLLVDSGGQYLDGTTDITRTVAVGPVPEGAAEDFTRVLKGMIAVARMIFPRGTRGREIDPFARAALWRAGLDYGHGTGHGVGVYLSVHEGPQRITRTGEVALEPGMIVSDEPGLYREGRWGIRIENLLVVTELPATGDPDGAPRLGFETLTLAPIDRRLILPAMLDAEERAWLDDYHGEVMRRLAPLLDDDTRRWLAGATAPIEAAS